MHIRGIDYGEKRIGTAISDPLGITTQLILQNYSDSHSANR